MRYVFGTVLSILFLASCVTASREAASVEVFNPELSTAFQSYTEVMSQSRTSLVFESGRAVRNCTDFLEERSRSEISDVEMNRLIAAEYLVCDALHLLNRARPVSGAQRPPAFYTQAILERLDLRSFRSSLRPQIEDETQPVVRALATLAPTQRRFLVISETEDWYYSFEVVARGDFTGDGTEDWLVLFNDEAKEGTYRGYSALVIANALQPGLLQVGLQR
jgi:hypothetical protein